MQADFEDALSPSWENLMKGQVNLRDAVNGTISFHEKARNKDYKLNDQIAKLFVRPRGWHLPEAHILIDGEPATGCLVDFGLYFYHNFANFREKQGDGFGPFFYLPKIEHSRYLFKSNMKYKYMTFLLIYLAGVCLYCMFRPCTFGLNFSSILFS